MHVMTIILLFVVFVASNSLNETEDFDELVRGIRETLTLEHGRKLVHEPQDVVTTLINVSLDVCIWECYARHRCGAAEYIPVSKYCTLYRNKPGPQIDATKMPGRIAIHGFADKVSRKCGLTTCSGRETCRYTNNAYSCGIEECGNPRGGLSSQGNMYSIGSAFKPNCEHLDTLHCANTGRWWTPAGKRDALTCNDSADARHSPTRIFTNRLGITQLCDGDKLVIQRRLDGYVDFYRDWDDYKYGFGDICGSFWMGLENVYAILNASLQQFELKIFIKDHNNKTIKITYDRFSIEDERNLFRLSVQANVSTENFVGESLSALSGNAFSTFDRDNDGNIEVNCAEELHGAWWFGGCDKFLQSHLNGRYYEGSENYTGRGIVFESATGLNKTFHSTRMKLREMNELRVNATENKDLSFPSNDIIQMVKSACEPEFEMGHYSDHMTLAISVREHFNDYLFVLTRNNGTHSGNQFTRVEIVFLTYCWKVVNGSYRLSSKSSFSACGSRWVNSRTPSGICTTLFCSLSMAS